MPHAAFADDQLDADLLDELTLEFLHAHAGRRADVNQLESAIVRLPDNRARVKSCTVFQVDRPLASLFDQAPVRHVTAGHQSAGQGDNIANIEAQQIFVLDGVVDIDFRGTVRDRQALNYSIGYHRLHRHETIAYTSEHSTRVRRLADSFFR
uniref:Uncharacterized protein n=1 Tax=Ralstonia solanacearum TaxID=305 RepID=A0A8D5ESU6_RALSL|nr:hypothetical protein 19 [Ralstonia solanacearum]BCI56330.1 hypothetical protein 19 [Ralstonia solanacearum]